MDVEMLAVDQLIPYENNPRHNDHAVEHVKNSIKEFGFKVPIIIDKDNIIVAGHTRLKASKELGLDVVPVIRANDLSDDQINAYRLADNKTSELAEWDFDALEAELGTIDIDMGEFGFGELLPDIDIDGIFEDHVPDVENDQPDEDQLVWGDKKVELTEEDMEWLDNMYFEFEVMGTGGTFIEWMRGGLDETDVS